MNTLYLRMKACNDPLLVCVDLIWRSGVPYLIPFLRWLRRVGLRSEVRRLMPWAFVFAQHCCFYFVSAIGVGYDRTGVGDLPSGDT